MSIGLEPGFTTSRRNPQTDVSWSVSEVHSIPTFLPQFIRRHRAHAPKPMSAVSPDSHLESFSPAPVPPPRRVRPMAPPIGPGESRSIFPSFPRRKLVSPRRNLHEIQHITSPLPSKEEMAHLFRYAKVRSPRANVSWYAKPKVSHHELTLQPALSRACLFCDVVGPGMD
jgi:hypothetical protein